MGVVFGTRQETVEPALHAAAVPETSRTVAPVEARSEARATTPASASMVELAPQPPDYLARLKALADLNDDLQSKIYLSMVMGGNLDENFVRIFGLSSAETQQLRDALTTTRRKLKELEARVATIAKSGNGEFIVTIPEAPVEGGVIYDELMQTIRETLGPERLIYAERLSSFGFENSTEFDRFGLRRAEIHLRPMQDEQGQPTQRWLTSWNASDDIMVRTIFMDPALLKNRFPLIHQKMVDAGFLAAKP